MAYQKLNLDTLPIGTVIDVMHIDDTGSYVTTSSGVESPTVP